MLSASQAKTRREPELELSMAANNVKFAYAGINAMTCTTVG